MKYPKIEVLSLHVAWTGSKKDSSLINSLKYLAREDLPVPLKPSKMISLLAARPEIKALIVATSKYNFSSLAR